MTAPVSTRPREPMINAPAAIVTLIAVLVVIHLLRSFLTAETDVGILIEFGFVPARIAVALDPRALADIFNAVAASPPAETVPERLAAAQYILGDGELMPWTLLTHAFLHGSWGHLLLNGLWLLAFGSPVARRFGLTRFLALFVASAVAGAAAHALAHPDGFTPMIGASGAISGLMAAATRFVFRRDRPLAILRSDPGAVDRLPAQSLAVVVSDRRVLIFLLVWFGTNLLFGLASLPLGIADAAIAWEAHLGGFLAGFLLFPLFDPVKGMARTGI